MPEDTVAGETGEPSSPSPVPKTANGHHSNFIDTLISPLRRLTGKSRPDTLRDVIEDYIEESGNNGHATEEIDPDTLHEQALIANILKLRDMTVSDVMIPRADIVAVDIDTRQEDLLSLLAEKQHSRLPVYRGSLDEIAGTVHIKDIVACLATGKKLNLPELIRDVPVVSPSMPLFALLLMKQQMRRHMVLVVDEFGGIDGLVTIGDITEAVVGEIDDEYDRDEITPPVLSNDGSITADARFDVRDFEDDHGIFLTDEERDDIDTLGGLVFTLAGRVPARGEILTHTTSGATFEILEASPRRVGKVRIKGLPVVEVTEL